MLDGAARSDVASSSAHHFIARFEETCLFLLSGPSPKRVVENLDERVSAHAISEAIVMTATRSGQEHGGHI